MKRDRKFVFPFDKRIGLDRALLPYYIKTLRKINFRLNGLAFLLTETAQYGLVRERPSAARMYLAAHLKEMNTAAFC